MDTKNTDPLVSVCIPIYNHEKYVQETIQSVIDQDYENIELIIIDDGSKDGSSAVVGQMMELCQSRFVRFKFSQRENKGLSNTLNEAIDWCRGKYFSAIASDDVMLPGKTSTLVNYLEINPKCGAVFGQINSINPDGVEKKILYTKPRTLDFDELFYKLGGPPAAAQLVRMDAIIQVGKYKAGIIIEDWYMWLALSAAGYQITIIDPVLANYRDHQENTTKNFEKMLAGRLQIIKLNENRAHPNLARSTAYLAAANESLLSSRMRSLAFFYAAVQENPKIVLHRSAMIYICRALTSNLLYIKIRSFVRHFSVK